MNRELTDSQVWTLMVAGCNVAEIAAWIGVVPVVAYALMTRASRACAGTA